MFHSYEDKALVDARNGRAFLEALSGFLRPDPNAVGGRYVVHTLYFDTPSFDAYRAVVEGIGPRVKLRLRRYEGERRLRIERKHRSGRTRRKERAWTSRVDVEATRAAPFDTGAALRPFATRLALERPVVAVRYERTAFIGALDPTLRVTLDEGLRAGPPGLFWRGASSGDPRLLPPGRAVLEIKHRGLLPGFLTRLARAHEVLLTSASKYRWGIERGGVRPEVSARG